MKKIVLMVLAMCLVTIGLVGCSNSSDPVKAEINANEVTPTPEVKEQFSLENKNIAVVYFSATGNTKAVAEYIQKELNAEIIEIVPTEEYTTEDLDYSNDECRAMKEQHQEASRPQIANEIDLASYDVVFLGYPIWWNDTPRIIQTLIETGCLDGKVVVPFCTSESTSIDLSEYTLVSYEGIDWQKGSRLEVSESSVHDWLESLK